MKVLMITPYLPYPLYSGGQVRLYNLIENLSTKHEITLFSFIRKEEERNHTDKLLKFCKKVEVFKKRKPWSFSTLTKTAFSTSPLLMTMYDFPSVRERINQEINQGGYDIIHVECFYVMQNLSSPKLPVVLAEQNIEYLVYQRFVKNFRFIPLKPLMYYDIFKIQLWEKRFWQRAKKLVAMSEEEKRLMNASGIEVVPNGVNTEFFKQKIFARDKKPTVVFVGDFRWIKNTSALKFLRFSIWPKVKRELPLAKLLVVGRNMSKGLKNSLGPEVIVEEEVEDIRQAYQRAHLLLAPIRIGGGTSYKVLEAMASSLPVVTTSLGIEGIEARDGEEVVVEDNADHLARAAVDLLQNEEKRRKMGEQAQKLVEEKYDWKKISVKLSKVWEEARRKKAINIKY